MERHEINFPTPMGEPLVADVDHEPHNDTHLKFVFNFKNVPLISNIPLIKKMIAAPIPMLIGRDFVRSWGQRLIKWADEPVPAVSASDD